MRTGGGGGGRQSIRKPNRLYGISTVCHCVNNPIELIIDRKIQNSDYNYSIVNKSLIRPLKTKILPFILECWERMWCVKEDFRLWKWQTRHTQIQRGSKRGGEWCACLAYVWIACVAIVQIYGPVSRHNSKTDFLSAFAFINIIVCVFFIGFCYHFSARCLYLQHHFSIALFARRCCAFFFLLQLYRIRARFFFTVYQSYIWRAIDLFHSKERKFHYTLTNQIQLHIDMHSISVLFFCIGMCFQGVYTWKPTFHTVSQLWYDCQI